MSIVKELMENSIGAGATQITIEIQDGGITLIRVRDNGCGMDKEDAKNAFICHATSKITTLDELFSLHSMGFRGEALASIAAASRVTLSTKEPLAEKGTCVRYEAGKFISCDPIGMPSGTTVEVRDLFYNLPARFKVLKKDQTEANYIQVLDVDNETPKLDANGEEIWLVKPTIEKIKFVVADNDTLIQQLADGELHLVNKVTYGQTILDGLQNGGELGIRSQPYPRIGLSFLTFTYDWPTVHDKEVRQAIAWCMDRDLLGSLYCGSAEGGQSFSTRVDGYYGIEQWEYKLLKGEISYPVNFLDQVTLPQVLTKDGEEEDLTKKYKNRYVETQEDYEKAIAAWQALADEWKDKLVKYTVDLSKAKKLLEKAGWTLNRNGDPFTEGVDDVRCKKMDDGSLVALDLKMMYPEGNHMAELMQTAVRTDAIAAPEDVQPDAGVGSFVDNLASVGIKLELVPEPMEELLKSYYRQKERTTDMIYLATNFHVIVDPSITYSTDTTKNHEIWNNTYSDDEELWYDAKAMRRTEPGDVFEYVSKWVTFQERYNEVLPTIPIYSNIYFDFFNQYLQNYYITGQVTWSQAILPAYFALENMETPAAEEAGDLETFE